MMLSTVALFRFVFDWLRLSQQVNDSFD